MGKKIHNQRNGGSLLAALRAHPEGAVTNAYKETASARLGCLDVIQIKNLFYVIQGWDFAREDDKITKRKKKKNLRILSK